MSLWGCRRDGSGRGGAELALAEGEAAGPKDGDGGTRGHTACGVAFINCASPSSRMNFIDCNSRDTSGKKRFEVVGDGKGEYVKEVRYKFVGAGQGDVAAHELEGRPFFGCASCCPSGNHLQRLMEPLGNLSTTKLLARCVGLLPVLVVVTLVAGVGYTFVAALLMLQQGDTTTTTVATTTAQGPGAAVLLHDASKFLGSAAHDSAVTQADLSAAVAADAAAAVAAADATQRGSADATTTRPDPLRPLAYLDAASRGDSAAEPKHVSLKRLKQAVTGSYMEEESAWTAIAGRSAVTDEHGFEVFLGRLSPALAQAQARYAFIALDANGDGLLQKEEFFAGMNSDHFAGAPLG